MLRRTSTCLCLLLLVLAPLTSQGQGSVTIDHIDGLNSSGKLTAGVPLVYHLRLTNTSGLSVAGSTNGFQIYSPDGALWSPTMADSISLGWSQIYDGGLFFNYASQTGEGADTVGFGGFTINGSGLTTDFDAVAYIITTQVEVDQLGKTLCIDSCFYPPVGQWYWAHNSSATETTPDWSGPVCYEIGGCCVGLADDANYDGVGPDIADLVYLVSYMFQEGPEPECIEETDANGDGLGPDIADLVYLVSYMFQQGDELGVCH